MTDTDRFDPRVAPRTYLTSDVPPIGGGIKQRPEDFLVEEIPAYEPCGEGEHIYLFVEKRGLATMQLARMLARHFGVPRTAVGFAGMKDKSAITRQVISVQTPGRGPSDFPMFDHPQVTILWADLHTNMLRRGHLKGNRFSIRIRNVEPTRVVDAARVIRTLAAAGVPNRFGEQRFGHLANNHVIGRALLLGDYPTILDELLGPSERFPGVQAEARRLYAQGRYAEAHAAFSPAAHAERSVLRALRRGVRRKRAAYAFDRATKRYYLTALQSAVFNAVLDRRIADGTLGSLLDGDLAYKHDNGAVFSVDEGVLADPSTAQRLRALQISPSGPMWGEGMTRARGRTDLIELEALADAGLTPDDLGAYRAKSGDRLPGERRALRVPLIDPDVEGGVDEHGPYIRCAFELPKGSFATVVMREIMKPQSTADATADDDDDGEFD